MAANPYAAAAGGGGGGRPGGYGGQPPPAANPYGAQPAPAGNPAANPYGAQPAPAANPYGGGGGRPAPANPYAAAGAPSAPSNPYGAARPAAVPAKMPGLAPAAPAPANPYAAGHLATPGVASGMPGRQASGLSGAGGLGVAAEHAECPISFDRLCEGAVGVFLDAQRRRVSPHFYRLSAAQEWMRDNNTCPMTRAAVASVVQVPSVLDDPQGWFRICDIDGDGKLSRREVVEALKAQLNLDNRRLERFCSDDGQWRKWDLDGDGTISFDEIVGGRGIMQFVMDQYQGRGQGRPVPDIRRDKAAWFQFWDEDGNGSLCKEEVARALIKTLELGKSSARREGMRCALDGVWCIFDPDGSGSIDREEFLMPDGLADTVLASIH